MKTLISIIILLHLSAGMFGQTKQELYLKYDKALEKGKHKKAEKILSKIAVKERNSFLYSLKAAQLFNQKGQLDSAVFYVGKSIGQYDRLPIDHSKAGFKARKDSLQRLSISIYDEIIQLQEKYCE